MHIVTFFFKNKTAIFSPFCIKILKSLAEVGSVLIRLSYSVVSLPFVCVGTFTFKVLIEDLRTLWFKSSKLFPVKTVTMRYDLQHIRCFYLELTATLVITFTFIHLTDAFVKAAYK